MNKIPKFKDCKAGNIYRLKKYRSSTFKDLIDTRYSYIVDLPQNPGITLFDAYNIKIPFEGNSTCEFIIDWSKNSDEVSKSIFDLFDMNYALTTNYHHIFFKKFNRFIWKENEWENKTPKFFEYSYFKMTCEGNPVKLLQERHLLDNVREIPIFLNDDKYPFEEDKRVYEDSFLKFVNINKTEGYSKINISIHFYYNVRVYPDILYLLQKHNRCCYDFKKKNRQDASLQTIY